MKLGHYTFDKPMEISCDFLNYLIVESPEHLSRYIQELISQVDGDEGRFILSRNWEEIIIKNHVKFIINPFIIDPNERKNLIALHSQLSSIALDEKYYQKTMNFSTEIQTFIQELITSSDASASCTKDFNISDMFKIMDVKFDITSEFLLENICEFMIVCRDYGDIHLFVFVNLCSFLSREDMLNLSSFVSYNKIFVLLIEDGIREFETGSHVKIIDVDLCEVSFSQ